MRAPPNAAVRRLALFWRVSTLVKVAALAVVVVLAVKLLGGF